MRMTVRTLRGPHPLHCLRANRLLMLSDFVSVFTTYLQLTYWIKRLPLSFYDTQHPSQSLGIVVRELRFPKDHVYA